MAETLVAADLDLALDVLSDFAPEIAFDDEVGVDELADLDDFRISQVPHFRVVRNLECFENLLGSGSPDAVDVRQADFDPLFSREIYS